MRILILMAALAVVACGGSGGVTAPNATIVARGTDAAPSDPPASPTIAIKKPASYAKLSDRDWKRVVKAPDKYVNKGFVLWACVSQFDAATGTGGFRAYASNKKVETWVLDGVNAVFTAPEKRLEDIVEGDLVSMKVIGAGSYSYDTQAGGNTTVPSFEVASISRKGSCE